METLDILINTLKVFSMGFISGIFLIYVAKFIEAFWVSINKFF